MKLPPSIGWLPTVFLGCSLLWTAGCRTLDSGGVQAFASGVTAAKIQTQLTFSSLAKMTREDSVDFAATQPILKATNLVSVPSTEAAAAWEDLFSVLEKYGQHLASLSAANATKSTEDSLGSLAHQFKETAGNLEREGLITGSSKNSVNLATGFSEVAGLLLRAQTQVQARRLFRDTDAAIAIIFTGLAEAIGATSKEGLRHLIYAHSDQRKAEKQLVFLGAKPAERRRVTQEFSDLLTVRETQDLALASLRRSFLALVEAHHALAQGQPFDARNANDVLESELKHAREFQAAVIAKPNR